jgi:hypothetical protein
LKIRRDVFYAALFTVLYFTVNIILNLFWNFHQLHNDYWDLLFIAKNINFANASSLANPCIPIGYTSLLHFIIKFGSEITIPIVVNLLFGSLTIFAAILFYQKVISLKTSIVSAIFLGIFPLFFFYSNQGGADPGSVMFFTFGAFLLLYNLYFVNNAKWHYFLVAGLLIGLGAIFRYHVLVGGGILIFTGFLLDIRKWKLLFIAGAGVAFAYSPQIVVNILTGHGVLETKLGASNIYDLMYGINWYKVSTERISTNALEIISTNPLLFVKRYIVSFVKFFIQTGLIPAIAFLFCKKNIYKKIALYITLFVTIYFIVFSSTLSGRQILLPLPLTILCLGLLMEEYFTLVVSLDKRMQFIVKIFGVAVISIAGLFFVMKDTKKVIRNINEYSLSKDVESFLVANGVTDALQTYTTDYDLYFRKLPNYTGYFNGGWSRWGTYKYNEAFPEFNVQSIDTFIDDCQKYNVKFVILNESAVKLNSDLAKIFEGTLTHRNLIYKKTFQRVKIFEVVTAY